MRRASEGGLENAVPVRAFDTMNSSPLASRRPHSSMSGKMGARSWHPSPFASDDENDEHAFFKEEKKNRIKMEISRRRQQIEENARLHEELIRLAKLRESAELGTETTGHRLGVAGYPSPSLSPSIRDTSVLRSVDEILRNEHTVAGHYGATAGLHQHHHHHNRTAANPHGRREFGRFNSADLDDPSLDRLTHTFSADRYTSSVYDRVTDFSPVNSDLSSDFLPDMRSRKLMDDLGSYPGGKYGVKNMYR